ncbi:MAG: hypothetical protein AAF517_25530 [Planctomycetota bacterium]
MIEAFAGRGFSVDDDLIAWHAHDKHRTVTHNAALTVEGLCKFVRPEFQVEAGMSGPWPGRSRSHPVHRIGIYFRINSAPFVPVHEITVESSTIKHMDDSELSELERWIGSAASASGAQGVLCVLDPADCDFQDSIQLVDGVWSADFSEVRATEYWSNHGEPLAGMSNPRLCAAGVGLYRVFEESVETMRTRSRKRTRPWKRDW